MGTTYETAGAKAGNGEGDEYEEETEDLIANNVENTDEGDDMKHADDEETLLDDSEHLPSTVVPISDPPVKSSMIGVHSTIGNPEPEVMGADPLDIEGETVNDEEDESDDEMLLDSDADDDELDE